MVKRFVSSIKKKIFLNILERKQYQYQFVEQDQKYHVVVPYLDLKEFKECHAKRIHSLGITVEALVDFANKHDCWHMKTQDVVRDIIVTSN